VTDALCQTILQLPTGMAIGEEDIVRVGEVLRLAGEQADAVRPAVAAGKASHR
jgi:hypothetical protein